MKMLWFFTATSEIPWTFKLCGIFQMCCDMFLGGQYFVYGDGQHDTVIKEHEMGSRANGHSQARMRTPVVEKESWVG